MMIISDDGNGDYVIKKGTFNLIIILIALLSVVVSTVASGVTLRTDVDNLKDYCNEVEPRHTETIDKINNRINIVEQDNAVIKTKLENIDKTTIRIEEKIDKYNP